MGAPPLREVEPESAHDGLPRTVRDVPAGRDPEVRRALAQAPELVGAGHLVG